MDILKKVTDLVSKYRWALLILLLGVVLMLIPSAETGEDLPASTEAVVQKDETAEQLAAILSQIKGVGKVQLLLTVETGQSTVFQTDGEKTVIVTDGNRTQSGLVQRVESPEYRGAVVVCQGADSPAVRLSIVEAVSSITGLNTDRISVLKMK